ncbi:MAG: biotin/lipoyl-containing protein, partial [Nocardioidaceae bacterium]
PQSGAVRSFEIPGTDAAFTVPRSFGVRVDSAVEAGSEVGIHYDPMLAKVIAWAPDRDQAVRMLRGALSKARVHGITTNLDLLLAALADDEFRAGRLHTSLLADRLDDWTEPRRTESELRRVATAAALAQAAGARSGSPVQQGVPASYRNVPSQRRTRSYTIGEERIDVEYASERGRLVIEDIDVIEATPRRVRLRRAGVVETYRIETDGAAVYVDGPSGSVDLQAVPRFVDPAEVLAEGSLLAPMPASVASVGVRQGEPVRKGQTVVVLEAMKMQHTIGSPVDGIVAELDVAVGQQVGSGDVLAVIEADDTESPATEGDGA